jgi:hypothetical protein
MATEQEKSTKTVYLHVTPALKNRLDEVKKRSGLKMAEIAELLLMCGLAVLEDPMTKDPKPEPEKTRLRVTVISALPGFGGTWDCDEITPGPPDGTLVLVGAVSWPPSNIRTPQTVIFPLVNYQAFYVGKATDD